jgi:hypothetical protein
MPSPHPTSSNSRKVIETRQMEITTSQNLL